jgi:hypothetical protein
VQVARQVSIWESEFLTHHVPPVCVKSGRPAAGTWTFVFGTPGQYVMSTRLGGMRVGIPLSRGRLTELTVLTAIRIVAAGIGLPSFLVSLFIANPPPLLRPVATVCLVISGAVAFWLWLEQPRGSVHRLSSGQSWLLLVGVHPNFVDAVNRSRPAAAAIFSQDGKWYWDSAQWVSNDFPEHWWRTFFARFEKLPWWQVTLGAVVVWIAIGALAWWSFHR